MTKPVGGSPAPSRPLLPARLHWPAALLLATSCSSSPSATATQPPKAEDPLARFERLMSREHGPFETHPVRLLDGVVEGRAEARVAPKLECKNSERGFSCDVNLELGEDEDEVDHRISCVVSTDLVPFGPIVKVAEGDASLTEAPTLTVEKRSNGIAVTFVANTRLDLENGSLPGTLKLAALYTQGYTTMCFDMAAGGRETFARVASGFFDSLEFAARPHDPAVFSMAYRVREGNRVTGFRYGFVTTDAKPNPRFTEHGTSFWLTATEKSWTVSDGAMHVVRTPDGGIESYRLAHWKNGSGPLVLSAKPAESGRFRIKAEMGERSDAIELTPKAVLDTELWAAAQLEHLSTHGGEQYVYARPGLVDGDPSLRYTLLSSGSAGIVLEQERSHPRFDEAPEGDERDELHVDAHGVVTKEVTATAIDELLFVEGELPGLARRSPPIVASSASATPSRDGRAQ